MTISINVNGLSLCHQSSDGVSAATLPDVCKTPPNSLPVPYPNIAFSRDLAKGTTTVTADGGNKCANYGSEFSKSTGDEPGTLGGVKSGTFIKEATWITYSFDVKLEGKGACRLTDKMFHNHQNTVNMAGLLQPTLEMAAREGDIFFLCFLLCKAIMEGQGRQSTIDNQLTALDLASGGHSPYKPEVPYNMRQVPPAHIPKDWKFPDYLSMRFFQGGKGPVPIIQSMRDYGSGNKPGDVKIPDVSILNDPTKPPAGTNIRSVVEMKFPGDSNPLGSASANDQVASYERIANQDGTNPSGEVIQLDAIRCGCAEGSPVPRLIPELEKENEKSKKRVPQTVPQPVPQPAPGGIRIPSPSPAFVQGLSGVGQMLGGGALMIVSGGAAGVLALDDVTGIGVVDDALIPVAAAGVVGGGALFVHGAQDVLHAFGF